ncbi:PREDICTED: leucine-rich repeat and transmembrane domain-containing protein 1-like [Amphimedon queenslandica]|uniref:LRRNT domain-containing protein n=1 Tax=Amphimedon queenslandica TaxID=400682 RepID=A0A1X7UVD8_AMPQE|nr:PREDICTED: leucine-rich repeat and transmembrane domain-containing protein 1-like [Amphimedon queenslandica]|eukprot:XP_019852180.1 PREDICTED: leucine-rich repeat and transmembrane domain-containing protein 1-like [Amphimedon queenslandica]
MSHVIMASIISTLFILAWLSSLGYSLFVCPEVCHCSEPARIVDCSSSGLSFVPKVQDNTLRLYLGDNDIANLTSLSFSKLHKLTYLIISNNRISHITEDTFHGLTSLKYLVLDSNRITTLPKRLLRSQHQLRTL